MTASEERARLEGLVLRELALFGVEGLVAGEQLARLADAQHEAAHAFERGAPPSGIAAWSRIRQGLGGVWPEGGPPVQGGSPARPIGGALRRRWQEEVVLRLFSHTLGHSTQALEAAALPESRTFVEGVLDTLQQQARHVSDRLCAWLRSLPRPSIGPILAERFAGVRGEVRGGEGPPAEAPPALVVAQFREERALEGTWGGFWLDAVRTAERGFARGTTADPSAASVNDALWTDLYPRIVADSRDPVLPPKAALLTRAWVCGKRQAAIADQAVRGPFGGFRRVRARAEPPPSASPLLPDDGATSGPPAPRDEAALWSYRLRQLALASSRASEEQRVADLLLTCDIAYPGISRWTGIRANALHQRSHRLLRATAQGDLPVVGPPTCFVAFVTAVASALQPAAVRIVAVEVPP